MAYNILLVDDSVTVRAVIGKALQLAGVEIGEIHEAANGQQALEVLQDVWIDIVFADISMPVMDGVEMIERMSEDGLLESIPVVVVSSAGNEQRIARLKSRGIRAFIHKPFTPEQIRAVVDQVMGVEQHDD
jgi:two-component system chemotaxis response regulator CheY